MKWWVERLCSHSDVDEDRERFFFWRRWKDVMGMVG